MIDQEQLTENMKRAATTEVAQTLPNLTSRSI